MGTGPRTAGNGTPSSGNWHTSTVEFVPSPEDDGKTLTCRAHNPAMPSSHYGRTAATSSSSSSFHLGPSGISEETNSDGAANSMASHTASHHPGRSSNTPINAIDDGIKLHVQCKQRFIILLEFSRVPSTAEFVRWLRTEPHTVTLKFVYFINQSFTKQV